jgi:hypothetical protein
MEDIRRARVYQIINRVTGDCYIGSTKNKIATRWNYHLDRLKKGIHELRDWQKVWDESEITEWDFRILEDNIPVEEQFEKELTWQDILNPTLGSKSFWHRKQSQEIKEKVLRLLGDGKTYREIRDECGISLGSITTIKQRYIG